MNEWPLVDQGSVNEAEASWGMFLGCSEATASACFDPDCTVTVKHRAIIFMAALSVAAQEHSHSGRWCWAVTNWSCELQLFNRFFVIRNIFIILQNNLQKKTFIIPYT